MKPRQTEVRFYEMTNVTVNICSDVADFRNEARNGNEWCKVHSVERTRGQTIECSSWVHVVETKTFLTSRSAPSNGTARQENTAKDNSFPSYGIIIEFHSSSRYTMYNANPSQFLRNGETYLDARPAITDNDIHTWK